jgi:NAD(P)H-hydrate epimerase
MPGVYRTEYYGRMKPFSLSREQVRELDRRAIEEFGIPGIVLMENAGRGCAELLMKLNPDRKPVVVLCGPGNNGGDGYVIARHLDNHGWPVTLKWVPYQSIPSGDAGANRIIAERSGLVSDRDDGTDVDYPRDHYLPTVLANARAWIVDALFGTGLSRSLGPPFEAVVQAVILSGNPVLAVDLPSGLDCDTGEPLGPIIRATHTATFVAPKKGFFNPKSKEWIGEVHVIDIGAPRVLVEQYRG